MKLDESKTIRAKEIVDNPDDVFGITFPYIIVTDTSMTGNYNNLTTAIRILTDANFDVVNFTSDNASLLVMMENLSYKKKNR
ncbi:MAG: hypothetical protein AAFV98_21865 [Chloroflexota bacterium]